MGSPPHKTPESAKRLPSYSTIVTNVSIDLSSNDSTDPPRNWAIFRKPPTKRAQAPIASVNHHGVLYDEYLVKMILSHLRGNPGALSKLSRVSRLFHEAIEQFLWSCATIKDLVNCAADFERLATHASFLPCAQILRPNDVWPEGIAPCPTFTKLKQLRIFNEVLRAGGSASVMRFLVPSLQRLELQNRTRRQQQNVGQHDGELMTHISSTCCSLTIFLLESSLRISSAELSTFFPSMDQLKVLRLGPVLSNTLNYDVMAEMFSLPHLKDLSSDFQLDLASVTALRNEKEAHKILPRIKKLEIAFSEGGGLAPTLLLAVIPTVEQLWFTLAHVVEGHDVSATPFLLSPSRNDTFLYSGIVLSYKQSSTGAFSA